MLSNISPQVVPIFLFLIPIVWIIARAVVKVTRMQLLHETVRQLGSSGQPIPPELLAEITAK